MVCGPCISSVLGPAALGAVGVSTFNKMKTKKTKKKKKSKSKKGGSGYETQYEYDSMNNSILFNEENREKKMKKECSDFMKYVVKHKDKEQQKYYANKSFESKKACENGNLDMCDYCRKEYIKLLFDEEKKTRRISK